MKVQGLDLLELLTLDPERGRIDLRGYRMVLLSASALGALRKELIDTMGWEYARGVLKRFGYAAGLADGLALAKRFPAASRDEHMDFGPALHGLEGIAHVTRDEAASEIDLARGLYRVVGHWEHSYEAEQHLELSLIHI